ncbi:MAG: TatD family hydrolase [Chloroflexi bacterium]|nr:TatD family hydrolase [Chloroflexota bacterium]
MRLIDSHAHLQAEAFAADAPEVLAVARATGLERLLAPGWDVVTSQASLELARTLGVDASVGIHPHYADRFGEADWAGLVELASLPAVVAIGETGLDYDRSLSPRAAQLSNLRRHIDLAFRTSRPLIIHCRSARGDRGAQDDLVRELTDAGIGGPAWTERFGGRPAAVLHSFSGPVDYGEACLALGCAVSISGLAFRVGEEPTADVVRLVPRDRLLVETDSPYLSPPGAPRRRNEPRWVEVTARWVADQRGVDPEDLGDELVAAYDHVFRRWMATPRG